MPKYLLTRNYNVRAHEKLYFEALNDDAAKAVAMSIRGNLTPEREYSEKDDDDSDELRDLTRVTYRGMIHHDDEEIIEGEPLPECLPLSWTSADFVKRLAELDRNEKRDAIETLDALIVNARKLCGMDA